MAVEFELVVFSDDWEGLPNSCRHLVAHLIPDTHVIWVDTIGLRPPQFSLYDAARTASKVSRWLKQSTVPSARDAASFVHLDPVQLPFNGITAVRKWNARRLGAAVRECSRTHPRRVLLTTWPFLADLVGTLGESLSIYYRVDDFAHFPGVNTTRMRQLEEGLIEKVDLVVASARSLLPSSLARDSKYLPHGVDFEHFSGNSGRCTCDPAFLRIAHPLIGFFGLLNSWVDLDLVAQVATAHPEWSFVLIGPSQLPDSQMPKLTNVSCLGPVPYTALPSYASQFDVAIIPFKVNSLTLAVNPLKLLEYYALGLPVVSTPLPEVVAYGQSVYVADTPEEFAGEIQRSLSEDCPQRGVARQEIARNRSWKVQAETLRSWIEDRVDGLAPPQR